MKILIDGRLWGLENAGLGRYSLNLIKELAKIDRDNNYVILLRKKYFDRLKFPENWKKVLTEFRHYSFLEQSALPKIISSENPDIVHFLHFNVPILYKKPYVVTIHDVLMHKQMGFEATTLNPLLYLVKRIGYRIVFDSAVKNSLKIIVPSCTIKKELTDFYGGKTNSTYLLDEKKVTVTYEGVNPTSLNLPAGKAGLRGASEILTKYGIDRPYFIYAGNAYPHKNLKRAIEAFTFFNKDRSKKVFFLIASARNFFVNKLDKVINELKAEDCVKLLGFVADEDLWVLYENSVAFLYPSLSEGFGLQGLEAMKAKTLVLASDIPIFNEIYKKNAIYFNPYDFSSIQKVLEDTFAMPEGERAKRIEDANEFVKTYSWSKMAEQTLEVYENCYSLRPSK